jgi:hypothetical protein
MLDGVVTATMPAERIKSLTSFSIAARTNGPPPDFF